MNINAMEQVTRERIAQWHREAQNQLLLQPPPPREPRVLNNDPVTRPVATPGAGRLAFLRRFAARLVAAA